MVTDTMLKDAALAADEMLITFLEADQEVHTFSERYERKIQKLITRVQNPFRYYTTRMIPVIAGALAMLICAFSLIDFASNTQSEKYKRISFEEELLGERENPHINEDTLVVNNVQQTFATQLPIYEIIPRNITQQEFEAIKAALQLPDDNGGSIDLELDGNRLYYNGAYFTDNSRGYFDMTDEELEQEAWKVFNQIPFLKGEYMYMGKKAEMKLIDSKGEHITRVGVRFQFMLDGCRVAGDHSIMLYFDGSGLVEIIIKLFEYNQIGVMALVSLEDAEARIKTPDGFEFDASGMIQTLQVEDVQLLWISQYSRGCTILQPIYKFSGTATMEDGTQEEFVSKIIAIPESYTYE